MRVITRCICNIIHFCFENKSFFIIFYQNSKNNYKYFSSTKINPEVIVMNGYKIFNGQDIIQLRERLGLSRHRFGELFGIPGSTIQNWETGVSNPPPTYHAHFLALENKLNAGENKDAVLKALLGLGLVGFLFWLFQDNKK